jgi:hypothetical protein
MNEPLDDSGLPSRVRLKPRPLGRGLPVPPVLPIVAIVSILVGLAIGYGLAPRPQPATPPATPSTPASATATASALAPQIAYPSLAQSLDPTVAPVHSAVSALEIPPSGGLSLSQALDALGASFGPRSDVISARISRYPPVSTGWVWLIVVPYSALYCKDGPPLPAGPAVPAGPLAESVPLGDCRSITSTELVILDYQTGEFLEDRIPAG